MLTKACATEYDLLNKFTSRIHTAVDDDVPNKSLKNSDASSAVELLCQRKAQIKDKSDRNKVEQ